MLEGLLPQALSKRVTPVLETVFVLHERRGSAPVDRSALQDVSRNRYYHQWTRDVASYFASEHDIAMPAEFERVTLLRQVDLFSDTPDAVLASIAQAMEQVDLPADG